MKRIVFIIICLLPLLSLLAPGLPVTHDGQDHVARIANFYQSISEGNIVPRWAANLNWGYGHPILMFLYPLPSYIGSLFHVLGFSFVDSVKLVFAVSYLASVIAMYMFASYGWGSAAGIVAAVLYGFAPYRFVDLYVRGAIGEHVAFIFPPLILLGLWRISRNIKVNLINAVLVTGGMTGLLLSHNAVSLMMLPIIVAIILYLFFIQKHGRWHFFAICSFYLGMGFVISAFFWVPALIEGKYTLRDIVTGGDFSSRFVPFFDFFNPWWKFGGPTEISKFLGFGSWITLLVSMLLVARLPKQSKQLVIGGLVGVFASLVLMSGISQSVWQHITILQKFQFPWRFLHLTTFIIPILGALVMAFLDKQKLATWFLIIVCSVSVLGSIPMWHAKATRVYRESFFTDVYQGTTDTGESAPIWSVRFMEHEPQVPIEVISGFAKVTTGKRMSTYHAYTVSASTSAQFVENTLYFPSWEVLVDGATVPVEYQDPHHRGLLTFNVSQGLHTVEVIFKDTKLRTLSNSVSLGGFILFLIYIGTIHIWRKKK